MLLIKVSGRLAVTMFSAGLITIVKLAVAVAPGPSVTLTVKLKVPVVVGVPLIVPTTESRVRPGGRLEGGALQSYGAVPPVKTNC